MKRAPPKYFLNYSSLTLIAMCNLASVSGWFQSGNSNLQSIRAAAAAAKPLQSCPTLCDPVDCSPPGFSIHGILQARTLEWVAISFSNAWKWKVKVKSLRLSTWKLHSRVQLLATPWTAVYQAPPSMGFSRQEYWSGVPLPSPKWRHNLVLLWTCLDNIFSISFLTIYF